MAQGDLVLFEEFSGTITNLHDLGSDTLKLGLVSNTPTPSMTATFAAQTEASPLGGNYPTTGGITVTTPTFTEAGGVGTLDFVDVTISQHASNPTNAAFAVLHDTTTVGAIGYIDLGGTFDLTTGDLVITLDGAGFLTVS